MEIELVTQKVTFLDTEEYWEYCRKWIAYATRVAYRSENMGKTTEEKRMRDDNLFKRLLHVDDKEHPQHTSTFEHKSFGVEIITNRAIANEIVRHRHTAFTQESTRYVNMNKRGATFLMPDGMTTEQMEVVRESYEHSYASYLKLLEMGAIPQQARDVLPHGLATVLVMSTNPTQWRNIFKLRCDAGAHPMVRKIMFTILSEFNRHLPMVFGDLYEKFSKENTLGLCDFDYKSIG